MPVKINSSGGGSVTLSSGGIATDVTATFPATTGNAVVDTAVQTLTNKTLTSPTITGAVVSSMASSVLTLGTAQASTSGTSIDFTGLPSWVRRVTVFFNGVSTNGTALPLVQLGAGSITSSGYVSTAASSDGTTVSTSTAGFVVRSTSAANALTGSITLSTMGSNIWVVAGLINNSSGGGVVTSTTGGVTLSGTLDRVRITTVGGTDTFDAGSINIVWE
jgi:hypothetical protein